MMESIILLGIGGHAHSVVDSIEADGKYSVYGFLDMKGREGERYREHKVVGTDDLLESYFNKGIKNAFVTVGYLGKGDMPRIFLPLPVHTDQLPVFPESERRLLGGGGDLHVPVYHVYQHFCAGIS